MRPRLTPEEIGKLTGLSGAGPRNRSAVNMAMAEFDRRGGTMPGEEDGEPPDLRDSVNDDESCAACANYTTENQCKLYPEAKIAPTDVCDSFAEVGASDDDEAGFIPEGPGMDTGRNYPGQDHHFPR